MSLLGVENISVRYGQLTALRKASIRVEEGETLFVTGPNGAGKSTLLRAIAGVVTPREGFIQFKGQHIAGKAPEDIARMGFSMVPEGREVFGALTIEENLRLGTGMRADKDQVAKDLEQIYAVFPILKDRKDRLFLAVIEEKTPVDLKRLEKAIGAARLSFGRAELLAEVLGVTPGSVTPFAAMNAAPGAITVVLDAALMAQDPINFHPLRNDATVAVSPAGLLAFLRESGHEPLLFDFRQMAALPI